MDMMCFCTICDVITNSTLMDMEGWGKKSASKKCRFTLMISLMENEDAKKKILVPITFSMSLNFTFTEVSEREALKVQSMTDWYLGEQHPKKNTLTGTKVRIEWFYGMHPIYQFLRFTIWKIRTIFQNEKYLRWSFNF